MPEIIRDIEPWFAAGLLVRPSPIHGSGLYTTRRFSSGRTILRLGGCLFPLRDRCSSFVMPSTTTPLSDQIILAEPAGGERDLSDYLNHSCDPNLAFRDAISIIAMRDIDPDEELLIDYAFWECDPAWQLRGPCNCSSRPCRKKVTGKDWEAVDLAHARLVYFSPFLRRRILRRANQEEKRYEDR